MIVASFSQLVKKKAESATSAICTPGAESAQYEQAEPQK